jgi:hypothetical protein
MRSSVVYEIARFWGQRIGTFKEREGWHGCQMPIGILNGIILASSIPGKCVKLDRARAHLFLLRMFQRRRGSKSVAAEQGTETISQKIAG